MRRNIAMLVLIVASFMDLMDAMITNVALPSIQRDLGATSAELEWTLSAYVLLFAVLLVTGGRLGDIAGRRTVFLTGVAGFALSSLGACLSQTGGELVVARGLQGTFAALMVPQVLATAHALYEPCERGKIFGLISALGGLGVLSGQLLGGWMVTANAFGIGWRSVFAINVPVGAAIFVLALFLVPDTRTGGRPRLDVPGTLLAVAGAIGLMYPLVEGNTLGWPGWIWAVLAAGVLFTAAFCWTEQRIERCGRDVLLPVRLLRTRSLGTGLLVQVANYLGWGSFAMMIAIYSQEALHFTPLRAGLTMLPVTLGSFAGAALAPVAARHGRLAVVAGGLLEAAGFGGYGYAIHHAGAGLTIWTLAIPLFVTGVGMIVLAVPLMGLALRDVPDPDAGAASGAFSMFQQLGNAFGVAIVGLVFFGVIGSDQGQPVYQRAIIAGNWVTVAAFAAAALCAICLPAAVVPAGSDTASSASSVKEDVARP